MGRQEHQGRWTSSHGLRRGLGGVTLSGLAEKVNATHATGFSRGMQRKRCSEMVKASELKRNQLAWEQGRSTESCRFESKCPARDEEKSNEAGRSVNFGAGRGQKVEEQAKECPGT